jgi:hypothetical protein
VPAREGALRELPIRDGWNVLDDNLLACSRQHIEAVCAMLDRQPRRAEFTGGLEARRFEPWHAELLREIRAESIFFAYDRRGDLPHLAAAVKLLHEAGFPKRRHMIRCYVLCGFDGDTIPEAERRMRESVEVGCIPQAMVYRGENGDRPPEWIPWQRTWSRPSIISRQIGGVH